MAEKTGISWCDSTFNAVIGCAKVSPGCDHCYAETVSNIYGLAEWGPGKPRKRTSANYWRQPYRWNARAETTGRPELVFCGSMCDIADGEIDDSIRDELFTLIGETPHLRWLLLTKRPTNLLNYLKRKIKENDGHTNFIPPNIWWGFTGEDQQRFDERTPVMMELIRLVRRDRNEQPVLWCSAEPLLGPIDMRGKDAQSSALDAYGDDPKIDWVIVGGESGSNRRMDSSWALDIIYQAREAGKKAFFKQTGDVLASEWGLAKKKGDNPKEWPSEFQVQQFPDEAMR